jgi:Uncharacterized protein conserved in bacteria
VNRGREFREYADWAADHSPLYERLSRAAAADDELLAMVEAVPEDQPAPNMLLGAVHDLLLSGVTSPLAAFYETRTDDPVDPDAEDPFPAFKQFCLDHEAAIRDRLENRLVQTNDVGRSAILYPSFARVSEMDGEPLALVEIGCSAGVNLRWDRYRYGYDDRIVGNPGSPVRIQTRLRGEGRPHLPDAPPRVASGVGVDVNPLDPTDSGDARWLRALVLPNQTDRHERLVDALDLVAADPPETVSGDAVEELPSLLSDAPTDVTLCVFSTVTLYQLSEEAVASIRETLADHSHDRAVHWLSGDPRVPVTTPTYRHVRFADGDATGTRLCAFGAYGTWIEWDAD